MISAVTELLYIKYTGTQFENDLNNPEKNNSRHLPENLLNYAINRKFLEYYNYANSDSKKNTHQYDTTYQYVYNLFVDYEPNNGSNFEKVYGNALKQLKTDFYNKINE